MLQCPAMQERIDLDPVRGMRDHLPFEQRRLAATRRELEDVLDRWGYDPIDLPILERRDLYLKKAGEELVGKLYDFVYGGRSLALRPEWTASVLRAYLRGQQSEPLPVRLRYAGPVFRYERPQRTTYRQFTQVGVELIGAAAPRGDAEIIALACEGLAAAGVTGWKLTLGHVGVARALLARVGLPERTASRLLWNMERLRRGEVDAVREQVEAVEPGGSPAPFDLGPLAALTDDDLAALLDATINAMGLSLETTTRPADAIVQRLIRKLRRPDPKPIVEQALASLLRLTAAYGPPEEALAVAGKVLQELGLPSTELSEIRSIVALLAAQGIEPPHLIVDLGMSRGLHYYSGMIFEIEDQGGQQLCGGGRYDDLVGLLRGRGETVRATEGVPSGESVPAVGFAYGLERVVATGAQPASAGRPSVLVTAPEQDFAQAMHAAALLRREGYRVQLDTRGRRLQANLRDAERRGCSALVAVADGDAEHVTWYDLPGGEAPSRRVRLDTFADEARA